MKIIYAGAPAFSVVPLSALLDAGFCVAAVVTQPDKPTGRKAILTPTPLKSFALSRNIPVLDFAKLREHIGELGSVGADAMVTCAYGQILTQQVLDCFPSGVYNIHTSLLPRWRGASPVQHAVLSDDKETGVTIMRTDIGLDTGDILLQEKTEISLSDTAATLSERLSQIGAKLIVEALRAVETGKAIFCKQPQEGVTLCKKIRKEDCLVDFSKAATDISCLIRAMSPEPLAFSRLHGKLVNFYFAEASEGDAEGVPGQVIRADKSGIYVLTGSGILKILELQLEGGKKLRAADFVNGRKISVGDIFGV